MQHQISVKAIVRDEERSGQENREGFLAPKNPPKNSFQKSGEAVDFQEANPLISTPKAFSRSWGAGFRAGKLTAVAGKNLTRDERLLVPTRRACQRLTSDPAAPGQLPGWA